MRFTPDPISACFSTVLGMQPRISYWSCAANSNARPGLWNDMFCMPLRPYGFRRRTRPNWFATTTEKQLNSSMGRRRVHFTWLREPSAPNTLKEFGCSSMRFRRRNSRQIIVGCHPYNSLLSSARLNVVKMLVDAWPLSVRLPMPSTYRDRLNSRELIGLEGLTPSQLAACCSAELDVIFFLCRYDPDSLLCAQTRAN